MTTAPRPSREIDGEDCTMRKPRVIEERGLPFRAHAGFRKAGLDARQALYQQLAEQIWSPERLAQEAAS